MEPAEQNTVVEKIKQECTQCCGLLTFARSLLVGKGFLNLFINQCLFNKQLYGLDMGVT